MKYFTHRLLFMLALCSAGCGGSSSPSSNSELGLNTNNDDEPTSTLPDESWGEIEYEEILIGDFTFQLRVSGPPEGDPVLLLHGFPETSKEWTFQLEALGLAGYRAIAPNQRGYSAGARPQEIDAYQLSYLVQDIIDIADNLGLESFHVVGHDWGGAVAWKLGADYQSRIQTLSVLSTPHFDAFSEAVSEPGSCQALASSYMNFFIQPNSQDILLANNAQQLRGFYSGLPQEHIDDYLEILTQPGALKSALDWYRANMGDNGAMSPIGSIQVPTLYLWSDEDTAFCKETAEQTAAYIEGEYTFETVTGIDHWLPEKAPEKVNELLLRHLERYPLER